MVKPSSGQRRDRSSCYQQALDDFGITQLLLRISNYADGDFNAARMCLKEQELERIVTLLIEQLTANIKGSVLANYLLTCYQPCQNHAKSSFKSTWGSI